MSQSSNTLALPYILQNQAQKHVTHNESIRILDTLVQLVVENATLGTPPANPHDGACYIVADPAAGAWDTHLNDLAVWDTNGWVFLQPAAGWRAWNKQTSEDLVYDAGDWRPVTSPLQTTDMLGVNSTADTTNRLTSSAQATLLTHDTVNGDHRLKVNKETATDTASLLFQTGWAGRAEMGTTGSDDFEIKVSPDGTTFHQALVIDGTDGSVSLPNTELAASQFGTGPLVTSDYIAAKGLDLITNGSGLLGNTYNMPDSFAFEATNSPNLPGAFSYKGYYSTQVQITENLPVDPNKSYRLGCYTQQEKLPGDWSAYSKGDRHSQYMGMMSLDIDGHEIFCNHHMRYKQGGVDSRTTLAASLAPGDTVVTLTSTAGWNTTNSRHFHRGIIVFGYKNALGYAYTDYSRIVQYDLFDLSGVDQTNNTITLKKPFPAEMANPDAADGVWPAGTELANSSAGANFKYSLMSGTYMPASGVWYHLEHYMGGIDTSGTNQSQNFAPGTAFVKVFWLPNYSNRAGGWGTHPDTGADHRIFFAGVSVVPDAMIKQRKLANGTVALKTLTSDYDTGSVSLTPAVRQFKTLR